MSEVKEFERKFLLLKVPKKIPFIHTVEHIFQVYLNDGKRFRTVVDSNGLVRHELIKKTKADVGHNLEIEYESSIIYTKEDAFEQDLNFIEKTRIIFDFGGSKFFIDSFIGFDLIIMEVETEKHDSQIVIPEFLENHILLEVTDIDKFSNFNLAKLNGKI